MRPVSIDSKCSETKLAKNEIQRKSLVSLVSEEDTRDVLKFNISAKWF